MKTQIFVLIPYEILPAEIGEFVQLSLEKHRFDPNVPSSQGRYDYLVGALEKSFDDPVAESILPPKVRRSYSGNICERANLPTNLVPGAVVTPDGEWHDLVDFGWKMLDEPSDENCAAHASWEKLYRELISEHRNCWVVEVWAHS